MTHKNGSQYRYLFCLSLLYAPIFQVRMTANTTNDYSVGVSLFSRQYSNDNNSLFATLYEVICITEMRA